MDALLTKRSFGELGKCSQQEECIVFNNRMKSCKSLYHRNISGHYGCVNAIEFSQDGRFLVTGGDDRRVLLWSVDAIVSSLKDPTCIKMNAGHESNIFCLAFDIDGRKILSSGNDHQIIVHDISTLQPLDVFNQEDALYCISMHPDNNNVFATAAEEGNVQIIDMRCNLAEDDPFVLVSDKAPFYSVMFNPVEPQLLATANVKDGIQLWDIRKPQGHILRYGGPGPASTQSAMSVKWDATGQRLFGIRRRMMPVVYAIQSVKPLVEFDHPGYYNSCTMKTCCFGGLYDEYVISGSDDFNIYVWKIPETSNSDESGFVINKADLILKGHRSIVNQVRFNKSYQTIVSSGVEKIVKMWSPWNLPDAQGSLDDIPGLVRPIYSHAEYVNMIMSTGANSHDYATANTEEDSRMIAFFDSLIHREIDDLSSSASEDSDNDSDVYLSSVRVPRPASLSMEVVDSEISSSSSSDDNNTDDDNEASEMSMFRTLSVAYARYLADGGFGLTGGNSDIVSEYDTTLDDANVGTSTTTNNDNAISVANGYIPEFNVERDINRLVMQKREQLERKKLLTRLRNRQIPTKINRTCVSDTEASTSNTSLIDNSLSVEEAQRRIRKATRLPTRRQQILRRIRQRTLLDLTDDDSDSDRDINASNVTISNVGDNNDGIVSVPSAVISLEQQNITSDPCNMEDISDSNIRPQKETSINILEQSHSSESEKSGNFNNEEISKPTQFAHSQQDVEKSESFTIHSESIIENVEVDNNICKDSLISLNNHDDIVHAETVAFVKPVISNNRKRHYRFHESSR